MKRFLKRLLTVAAVICCVCLGFGGVITASAEEEYRIIIDTTYLKNAAVSEVPVTLEAEIRNESNRRIYGENIVFSIVSGDCAQLSGNKLTVKKAGKFTVRAEKESDSAVFAEYQATASEITFSNLSFLTKFEDFTVYTAPVMLQASMTVSGTNTLPIHEKYVFTVVSGQAEIFCDNFLKILGAGEVTVRAACFYAPDVYSEKTFTVTDPDEGKTVTDIEQAQNLAKGESGGCESALDGGLFALIPIAFVVLAAIFAVRKKER